MIDYTKLLKQIVPEQDGPSPVYRRKALVAAVNVDGTVDITLAEVTIPSVQVLGGAQVEVGAKVQVLSERGELLVIGMVGAGIAPPTVWPNMQADFGTPSISNDVLTNLTPTSVPFDPNPMWPGSGSTFTVPSGQGGLYVYGAHLQYPPQATPVGYRRIQVLVNGVDRSIWQQATSNPSSNSQVTPVSGSSRAVLAAGSTIVFRARQNSGVTTALTGTGNVGWIQRIG